MTGALSLGMHGDYVELSRIPPPSYRHAAPSAPWPWIDIRDKVDHEQLNVEAHPIPKDCDHTRCQGKCWTDYPQSRFPNWTPSQVNKCKIREAIREYDRSKKCMIFRMDVDKNGIFNDAGYFEVADDEDDAKLEPEWERFKNDNQGNDVRVRALFVENMTGPALRMLGGKYDIEPFFFSSSLNWIPSHFQEDLKQGTGDHITITLPFIQSLPDSLVPAIIRPTPLDSSTMLDNGRQNLVSQMIDTQAPLRLESNHKALVLDLLSVHLVRNVAGNTMISFHAKIELPTTKARYLHERVRFAGQSVYWQKMLGQTDDPTFLLLIFVWHAMYAWDEALQHLYEHICVLETKVINTASMPLTEELHIIRAHLLHYSSLLVAFKKMVQFIVDTPNPALTPAQRSVADPLMIRECKTLLEEIERLDQEREMQERRLKNVMDLVFSSVNILDSKTMQKMTEAAVRDSAAMKQIAYLTMVFLPASFIAGIFGMNVAEINPGTNGTIAQYFETTIALTMATVWIIIAFQSRHIFPHMPFWKRLGWPILLLIYLIKRASNPHDPKFNRGRSVGNNTPTKFEYGVLR
ncbi:CorA-like Mg2+ transporter domain containing protein [Amanita muscaria]